MTITPLLLVLCSVIVCSMDLALAIVLYKRNHLKWTGWFIVFIASLLALVVLFALDQFSTLLFSGTAQKVLHLIWEVFIIADSAFLCTFSCYFVNWMIARPMRKTEKVSSYLIGFLYLGVSILLNIFDNSLLLKAQASIGAIVIFYLVAMMILNNKVIANKRVRIVCSTISIVSCSMIPLFILSLLFNALRAIMFPIIALAYLIVFLVFLFIALDIPIEEEEKKHSVRERKELTLEDVQHYGITSREFEVIGLIKKGLTNKEIASELSISVNTVNNHIANIFDKTEVRSRIDLLNLLQEADW